MRIRIPHGIWELQSTRDRVLLQGDIAAYNRETMPPAMQAQYEKQLGSDSGSANMLNLAYLGRYLRNPLAERDNFVRILKSQCGMLADGGGYMAPFGRDEIGDKGGHWGYGHAWIFACALDLGKELADNELMALALKWFRAAARINELQQEGDCKVIGPGRRALEPWSDLTNEGLALLIGHKTTVKPGFWRITKADGTSTAKGGPYCLGPWMIRELIRQGKLSVLTNLKDADLIRTAEHDVFEIWHTTQGHVASIVGLENQWGQQVIQPVAAQWKGQTPIFCRGKKKDYKGPWPTVGDPGIPIQGAVKEHWRGDLSGWSKV